MYKKMYYHLFNAVSDALEALAQKNYGQAETLLKTAQQASEEVYLSQNGENLLSDSSAADESI